MNRRRRHVADRGSGQRRGLGGVGVPCRALHRRAPDLVPLLLRPRPGRRGEPAPGPGRSRGARVGGTWPYRMTGPTTPPLVVVLGPRDIPCHVATVSLRPGAEGDGDGRRAPVTRLGAGRQGAGLQSAGAGWFLARADTARCPPAPRRGASRPRTAPVARPGCRSGSARGRDRRGGAPPDDAAAGRGGGASPISPRGRRPFGPSDRLRAHPGGLRARAERAAVRS